MKYSWLRKQKIGEYEVKHQFFSRGSFDVIKNFVEQSNPDILVFQEVVSLEDARQLSDVLGFSHFSLVPSYSHAHFKLIMSKSPLRTSKFTVEENHYYDCFDVGGKVIVPIHLHTFSSKFRKQQCAFLADTFKDGAILMGDFNFWQRGSRFVFRSDKQGYQYLLKTFDDTSQESISTTSGLKMDKIFASKNLACSSKAKVTKVRGRFMDHYPMELVL